VSLKVFGWGFIIFSLLCAAIVFQLARAQNKLMAAFNWEVTYNFWAGLFFGGMAMAIFLFATGVGLLKRKLWAYYAALLIPIMGILGMIWNIWFFGGQFYSAGELAAFFFAYALIFLFFTASKTRNIFGITEVAIKNLRSLPKILTVTLIILVFAHILSIPAWFLYVNARYGHFPSLVRLKPLPAAYYVEDRKFIYRDCEPVIIFNYTIWLPKDLKMKMLYKSKEFGWEAVLANGEEPAATMTLFLNDKGAGYLIPFSKALRFDSVYGLEKKINYPASSPLYFALKSAANLTPKYIEEAAGANWKGFIKSDYSQKNARKIIDCSLYDKKEKQMCGITFILKDKTASLERARSIIASLKFNEAKISSRVFFQQGQKALTEKNYTLAALSFLNALYGEDKNPEYAYWLALSLSRDDAGPGRKTRRESAKNFLIYALNLKPDYAPAAALLKEIERTQG
jgi:hypothetical protein